MSDIMVLLVSDVRILLVEDEPNAAQLQKAARKDMIPVYAVSGKPDKAYNFFKPLSGDKGGTDSKTLDMLNDLGNSYLDTGHYEDAIVLYHELMSRDKGDRFCGYQTKVSQAVQAMKTSDKQTVIKEFDNQIRVRKQFLTESHAEKAKHQCSNDTAELLAEQGVGPHHQVLPRVRGEDRRDKIAGKAIEGRQVQCLRVTETIDSSRRSYPKVPFAVLCHRIDDVTRKPVTPRESLQPAVGQQEADGALIGSVGCG